MKSDDATESVTLRQGGAMSCRLRQPPSPTVGRCPRIVRKAPEGRGRICAESSDIAPPRRISYAAGRFRRSKTKIERNPAYTGFLSWISLRQHKLRKFRILSGERREQALALRGTEQGAKQAGGYELPLCGNRRPYDVCVCSANRSLWVCAPKSTYQPLSRPAGALHE